MIAPVSSYSFGDVRVDVASFRVERDGRAVPLEPKAFDLLVLLLAADGRVVTKQEILESVWKDTAVTDNALTRIVAQLRRALGDDAREAKYIETVPTRGYRWIAPVWHEAAALPVASARAPAASPGPQAPRTRARGRMVVAVAGAALALLVAAVVFIAGRRPSPDDMIVDWLMPAQLTVSPGLDAFPAWSPDGRLIAYASDRSGAFEIVVRALAAGADVRALTSDGQQNVEPAWSPDGEFIAYHSMARGGVWIVPATGGVTRQVSDFGSHPAWSPDGRRIAFQSDALADIAPSAFGANPPSTLWVIDRDGANAHRVTEPGDPPGGHGTPTWSPDGRFLAFATYGVGLSALWTLPATGGRPTLVTGAGGPVFDPVFSADGRWLLYTSGASVLWRLRVDPDTGRPLGDPMPIGTPGVANARFLALSRDGRQVAFVAMSMRSNLWQVRLTPGGDAAGPPSALTNDTSRRKTMPVFSPDGGRLAFSSSRPGAGSEIWAMDADGRSAFALTTTVEQTGGDPLFSHVAPSWFPGGAKIGYLLSGSAGSAFAAVDVMSRRETRLVPFSETPVGAAGLTTTVGPDVRLSPDGTEIAYSRPDAVRGQPRLFVQSVAGGASRPLTTGEWPEAFPAWSPDGKTIAFEWRHDTQGTQVAVVPASGGAPRAITSDRGEHWVRGWAPDGDRVVFAANRGGVWNVWWASTRTGETRQVTRETTPGGYVRYPIWSPRGDQIVYERGEVAGNVWISDVPEPGGAASRHWQARRAADRRGGRR